MTYDFTVIPGNSGIETNDLGLVLRHKDAKDAVIDLTGATLHFYCQLRVDKRAV